MSHASRIDTEFLEVKETCPGLSLEKRADKDNFIISGILHFNASYNGVSIEDTFNIEIEIPNDYPATLPTVRETGNRILANYHTNGDGTLCLTSKLGIKEKFDTEPTLLGFIRNIVVEYLYTFSYKEKYEEMPNGELSHGIEGIIEDYKDKFNVKSTLSALQMLYRLAFNKYRGHEDCPCGSSLKLRNCHGKTLRKMSTYDYDYKTDLKAALIYLKNKDTA